jgi:hypothetical protein
MDIYAYAESINWSADYMDMHTGYIYKIEEAGRYRKFFGIEVPIKVYDSSGNFIGVARKNTQED